MAKKSFNTQHISGQMSGVCGYTSPMELQRRERLIKQTVRDMIVAVLAVAVIMTVLMIALI